MIHVVYNRKYHSVSAEGHAYSGEAGHDLVCSAATILIYTFASAVVNAEDAKQVTEVQVSMENGSASVSCRPVARLEKTMRLILDAICAGFELLARNFPDNISYEIHG